MAITGTQAALTLGAEAQDLLFREARTPNTFTSEEVGDHWIHLIYDLVKYAPTSMNQQPLRIVLVRSDQARRTLIRHMDRGNKNKVAGAPLVAILAADLDFHTHLGRLFPHAPRAAALFEDREQRVASARFNAALQIGYFILGVRAAGLAAGPLVGYDAEAIDREFFPGGTKTVLTVMNIGRPGREAWFPRLSRLDYDEVVTTV